MESLEGACLYGAVLSVCAALPRRLTHLLQWKPAAVAFTLALKILTGGTYKLFIVNQTTCYFLSSLFFYCMGLKESKRIILKQTFWRLKEASLKNWPKSQTYGPQQGARALPCMFICAVCFLYREWVTCLQQQMEQFYIQSPSTTCRDSKRATKSLQLSYLLQFHVITTICTDPNFLSSSQWRQANRRWWYSYVILSVLL